MTELPIPTRLPLEGEFHIDDTCIDCHLCRDLAPENFDSDDELEIHVVYKQPEDEDELVAVLDAFGECPSDSIRYRRVPTEE